MAQEKTIPVLLSGYYGFDNAGDEAVCQGIIQALRQENPQLVPMVLSHHPTKTAENYQVKAYNRWRLTDIVRALYKSRLLISGGGSLLQDSTSSVSLFYYLGIITLARLMRKPVVIYGQGIGPIERRYNRLLTRFVLNRTQMIFVRDRQSRDFLKSIGVQKPIDVMPDAVLGLQSRHNTTDIGKLMLYKAGVDLSKPVIVMAVRPWKNIDNVHAYARTLDDYVDQGYEVVLVPMQKGPDTNLAKAIYGHMQKKAVIITGQFKAEEYFALFAAAELVIGMRLHALVMAAKSGTKVVALAYDPKVDAFMHLIDNPYVLSLQEASKLHETMAMALKDTPPDKRRMDILARAAVLPAKYINHCLRKNQQGGG